MRTNLYSIYDNVAEVFNKPFTEFNDKSATRVFHDSLKENNFKNKDDYALYALGEYNDSIGTINAYDMPKKIYSGLDIKLGQSITKDQQIDDLETYNKKVW